MKKIIIMIDSLGCGGAEKSLVSLLPILVEQQYDITLMVRRWGGAFESLVPEKVRIIEFPFKSDFLHRLRYSASLRLSHRHSAETYWISVGKSLPALTDEYDVAIAYQQGFPTYYIAEKVSAKKKICWINADINSVGYSKTFNRIFYKKYDNIVCVSDILKDNIVYPDYVDDRSKLIAIYDILNESVIRSLSMDFIIIRQAPVEICTVGRLVELKGYDWAIEAARILRDRGYDFKWHFVGGGSEYRIELDKLVLKHNLEKYIVFEGEQVNPYPFIAASDIYVQTSKKEGFGMTIGEAKILGKPIVSTNFPVVYDQITDGENGLIVNMTPESIAEGIMRLIDDKHLTEKLKAAVIQEHNTTAETESAKVIKLIEN